MHLRVHVIGAFLPKEERQRLQEKALKGYQALTLGDGLYALKSVLTTCGDPGLPYHRGLPAT
jgi:hypothetical protein